MKSLRGSSRAPAVARFTGALVVIAGLVTAFYLVPLRLFTFDHPVRQWVAVTVLVLIMAGLVIGQINIVLRGPMDAAIAGIPVVVCLSVVGFAAVYSVLGQEAGEFAGLTTRTDALYFTVSTLATVGFGDIHASGQGAEVVVILQIVFNVVFVAGALSVFNARLRGRIGDRRARGGHDPASN